MRSDTSKFFIEVYGCQMNFYDGNLISGKLKERNYEKTENVYEAELIIIQTCSVRQNAEDRVKNRLVFFQSIKKKNPKTKIILSGCLAEHRKKTYPEIFPFIDLLCGPNEYGKIFELIEKKPPQNTIYTPRQYDDWRQDLDSEQGNAFISIMRGCDNYCSYCIVPYLRGPEASRPFKAIIDEINDLNRDDFKEITLLGQNVNSYEYGEYDFSDLMAYLAENSGFKRIRFLTSHPKDLSSKLIDTIASHKELCNYIHLPFQSGSNKILKKMNRNYTREHYLDLIEEIKTKIPSVSLSTDIIVGFPGEEPEDFQQTLDIVEKVKYENAFMYKYSPREGTRASKWEETLTENEKIERLVRLIDFQNNISQKELRKRIGRTMEVLVEGVSKRDKGELIGRSEENLMVAFPGSGDKINKILKIQIDSIRGKTLRGEINEP